MANPPIVVDIAKEFYALRDVGGLLIHAYLDDTDWAALCQWGDHPLDITTIPLHWPVGRRRKDRHWTYYHRAGTFGVD